MIKEFCPRYIYRRNVMWNLRRKSTSQNLEMSETSTTSVESLVRPGLTTHLKKDLPNIKRRLRAKVKLLTRDDVRKARTKYYLATIMELYENGYPNSAALLEKLVAHEKSFNIPKGLIVKRFAKSKDVLDRFADAIRLIEDSKNVGNTKCVIKYFLKLALDFTDLHHDLYWLAEQIFFLAVQEVTAPGVVDQALTETRIRYHFGSFYLEKMDNVEQAVHQFGIALPLCRGHETDWTISNSNFNYLAKEVSRKYFDALNTAAKGLTKDDSEKAANYAELSIKIALEADIPLGIANCYMEYGKILHHMGKNEKAMEVFLEAQSYAQMAGSPETITEAYFYLSTVYLADNNLVLCEKYLRSMKKTIDKNNLKEYVARYYELQGDYLLACGEGVEAAEQFVLAINAYASLGKISEIRHARFRASIAIASEIERTFIETVLKSDKEPYGNNFYLERLIEWKATRAPFWNYSNDNRITVSTTDTTFEYTGEVRPPQPVAADIKEPIPQENLHRGVYLNSIINQIEDIKSSINFPLLQKVLTDEKIRLRQSRSIKPPT